MVENWMANDDSWRGFIKRDYINDNGWDGDDDEDEEEEDDDEEEGENNEHLQAEVQGKARLRGAVV